MKLSGNKHLIPLTGNEDLRVKTLKAVKGRIIENIGQKCVVIPLELVDEWEFLQKSHQARLKAAAYSIAAIQRMMPHGYLLNGKWIVADLMGFLAKADLAMLIFDLETIDLAKFAYSYRNDDDYCLFNGNRPIVLKHESPDHWAIVDGFIRGLFDCYGQWEFTREDLFMLQGVLGAKMRANVA